MEQLNRKEPRDYYHKVVQKQTLNPKSVAMNELFWIYRQNRSWIQNMNTILYDNKMLCLNDGQRIKLHAKFTIIIEVQDLAIYSPASIIRCGRVYMESHHLGLEPEQKLRVYMRFKMNSI